ncbi:progesterone-induced-blocking factor 1-like [Styela clava]
MASNVAAETSNQSSALLEPDSKETHSAMSGLLDTDDLISGVSDLTERDISRADNQTNKHGRVSRHEFERKQMVHDLQLLRIELSQKNLVIDNMKADHMSKVEELEERLNDTLHKRQILQARLESALAIQQDEARNRQQQTQKELKIILERQQELENVNKRLQAKASDIQYQLQRDVQISEEEYIELKSMPPNKLSLKEFFSMRIYEVMSPIRIECINLREQRDKLSVEIAQLNHRLNSTEQNLMQECRARNHAETQLNVVSAESKQSRDLLHTYNSKAQRFDSVKQERDQLEKDLLNVQKQHSFQQAELISSRKEIDEYRKEIDTKQQTEKLLEQDKEYLQKQLNDATAKLDTSSELLKRTEDQLENAKKAREELYEKYVSSRDENRLEYERRLQTELDRIRMQTDTEIGKLQTDTKESYERENRGLREARDLANQERDQAVKFRDEAEKRSEKYLSELRALEASVDSRISDFQNEARTKSFELDRLQLMYEETSKNLLKSNEDCERLNKKLEIVTLDYTELEKRSSVTETELKSAIREAEARLTSYEKMEKELDDVVMQAAEVEEDDETAERVLFSYGYGANVPINAKMRMKQSVHLARRILQLEKLNTSLHAEIQIKEREMKKISLQLENAENLIDQCKQPYSYLIEGMQQRDLEISSLKKTLSKLENDFDEKDKENKHLLDVRKKLSLDLDKLLSHRQEMAVMRQVVKGLTQQKFSPEDGNVLAALDSNKNTNLKLTSHDDSRSDKQLSVSALRPAPVVFTKERNLRFDPQQYKKFNSS